MGQFNIGFVQAFSDRVYPSLSFDWIRDLGGRITTAAQIIGVSAGSVAGIMAEERKDYLDKKVGNEITDRWAQYNFEPGGEDALNALLVGPALALVQYLASLPNRPARTHDYWVNELAQVNALFPNPDDVPSTLDKLTHPSLMDVGYGNFRIRKAVKLLNDHPEMSTALNLDKYRTDYAALVNDMINPESDVTAKLYAIYMKEAEDWFKAKNTYNGQWNALPTEFKDALLVTFVNLGEKKMTELMKTPDAMGYQPSPGLLTAGGMNHLLNISGIGSALGLSGYGDGVVPISDMASLAKTSSAEGLATRYALRSLRFVVLPGLDYSPVNTDGQLDLYDAQTGVGTLTESWITDRAAMLNWVAQIERTKDTSLVISSSDELYFLDYNDAGGVNKVIRTGSSFTGDDSRRHFVFGGAGADTLNGASKSDHLYAGAGADTLDGQGGADYLEGNAGDDTLKGGDGADTLAGGAGTDTYVLSGDWGVDTLIDSDGLGSIQVDGTTLNGGKRVSANAWQSADGQWRYALTEAGELIITSADKPGRIVVKDWSRMLQTTSTPLGLNLPQASTPQQPGEPGLYALQGGYFVPGGPQLPGGAWQIQSDGSIPGAVPLQDSNDLMVGGQDGAVAGTFERISGVALNAQGNPYFTDANTRAVSFWGLGGNDFMSGEQYDDYLDGGEGNDLIFGGAGSDTIYGGGGDDIIVSNMAAVHINDAVPSSPPPGYVAGPNTVITYYGGEANFLGRWWVEKSEDGSSVRIPRAYIKNPDAGYTYYAESQNDLDFVDAGEGDDYVWGGRGADYLIGGAGADHLTGLGGDDLILGGLGKDVINGDNWAGMQLKAVYDQDPGSYYLANMPFDEALKSPALHGDDVIDAGAGDDEVWGDGGNDVIFGGSGNDQLMGDALQADLPGEFHGSDTLDGGDGNDRLYGFGGDDALFGGSGDDELYGDYEDLNAQFHGNDELYAGDGADLLWGYGGNDVLNANEDDGAQDQLIGGEGDDRLIGGSGNDVLFGEAGNDVLLAGAFNTYLEGGAGNDHYVTNSGSDTIFDDAGDDVYALSGGDDYIEDFGGSDVYQIDSAMLASQGTTVIKDVDGVGRIVYDGIVLSSANVKATAADVWQGAGGLAKGSVRISVCKAIEY